MNPSDQINEPSNMETPDPQQFLASGNDTINQIDIDKSQLPADSTAQNIENKQEEPQVTDGKQASQIMDSSPKNTNKSNIEKDEFSLVEPPSDDVNHNDNKDQQ